METNDQEYKIKELNEYIKQLEGRINKLNESIEQNDKEAEEYDEERKVLEMWIASRLDNK